MRPEEVVQQRGALRFPDAAAHGDPVGDAGVADHVPHRADRAGLGLEGAEDEVADAASACLAPSPIVAGQGRNRLPSPLPGSGLPSVRFAPRAAKSDD